METPLINIITRCSRPESFERCRESVESQTYKNVHHIVTYQNDEVKEFLGKFEGIHKVRVPNLKAIKGLGIRYFVHPAKDNFLNPDWEWLQMEGVIDYYEKNPPQYEIFQKPEEVLMVWEGNVFHCSLDHAYTINCIHFPYNSFIRIAEQHVKEGWVIYLDDDDYLERNTSLEELVGEINKFDEDTIHLANTLSAKNYIIRDQHIYNQMRAGMPFLVANMGGSMFYFHTKYIEYTGWDEWSGADWRTAKCLEAVIPKKNWIDNHYIKLGGSKGDGSSRGN